jgi:hypothetical protein
VLETGLMLRLAFGRPWRQTEGMLGSIIDLLGLELAVPDHATFSRRSANLRVAAALKKADGPVPRGDRQQGAEGIRVGRVAA